MSAGEFKRTATVERDICTGRSTESIALLHYDLAGAIHVEGGATSHQDVTGIANGSARHHGVSDRGSIGSRERKRIGKHQFAARVDVELHGGGEIHRPVAHHKRIVLDRPTFHVSGIQGIDCAIEDVGGVGHEHQTAHLVAEDIKRLVGSHAMEIDGGNVSVEV